MTRSPATSLARHRIAAAAAFAVAVLAMILPALAGPLSAVAAEVAPRPTSGEGVVLIDGGVTVTAGSTVTLSGTAYTPGATISVKYDDSNLLDSSTVVGDDGTFQLEVSVPSDATVGQHWLRVLGSNPASSQIAYLYVEDATASAPSPTAPSAEPTVSQTTSAAPAAEDTDELPVVAVVVGAVVLALAFAAGVVVIRRRGASAQ